MARIVSNSKVMQFQSLVSIARTKDLKKRPEKVTRCQIDHRGGDAALQDRPGVHAPDGAADRARTSGYPELNQRFDYAAKIYWKEQQST